MLKIKTERDYAKLISLHNNIAHDLEKKIVRLFKRSGYYEALSCSVIDHTLSIK